MFIDLFEISLIIFLSSSSDFFEELLEIELLFDFLEMDELDFLDGVYFLDFSEFDELDFIEARDLLFMDLDSLESSESDSSELIHFFFIFIYFVIFL